LQRCLRRFSFVRPLLSTQHGSAALLLVIGASLLMLIVGTSLATQTRQDLRMAMAETDASTAEARILGLFNEAAVTAADPAWPVADVTNCPLTGAYPQACLEVKTRRTVTGTYTGVDYDQIPVRVKWQTGPSGPVQYTYGWILIELATNSVSVWNNHHWCTPSNDYWTFGPCQSGG
jgi:hypothetical protein